MFSKIYFGVCSTNPAFTNPAIDAQLAREWGGVAQSLKSLDQCTADICHEVSRIYAGTNGNMDRHSALDLSRLIARVRSNLDVIRAARRTTAVGALS